MQPKNTKFCARCGVQLKPTYNKTTRFCSIRCSKIVPIEIRFWKRVIKAGPGDCWPWTGNHLPSGHGMLGLSRKTIYVHRLSWEIHKGSIPEGLHVLHKCDNGSCVNPDHLFIGTHQDNMDDMMKKDRHYRKLTKEQALLIRELGNRGMNSVQVGAYVGVKRQTAYAIMSRRAWRHLDLCV